MKSPTPTDGKQSVNVDVVSTHMLDPTKLLKRATTGDRNCLYRAVSLNTYDKQERRTYLRLATTIEMIRHRETYDVRASNYSGDIHDPSIVFTDYWTMVLLTSTPGGYSEMTYMY
ncbi:hypothetical protein LSAT2_000532 [Lamellibrachia satsuma]|nr:hypothetical protein LSAT2_000532 [Lamellibrachia satsuma]